MLAGVRDIGVGLQVLCAQPEPQQPAGVCTSKAVSPVLTPRRRVPYRLSESSYLCGQHAWAVKLTWTQQQQ
jgi:hypothetical protein